MPIANLSQKLPSLTSIVERQPLIVSPESLLVDVISLMSQANGCTCPISNSNSVPNHHVLEISDAARHSSVLVIANNVLVGIFTERDLVKLTASRIDLQSLNIGDVMTINPIVLVLSESQTVITALAMFHQHQFRHLPVLNDRGEVEGILTQSDLLRLIDPAEIISTVDSLQSQLIDRATELERINQELQAEIARREQVEAQLRRSSQTLTEQVSATTAESVLLTEELRFRATEQQSFEIALEASQQGISDFIENALIGMHWVDTHGNVVWVNQAELNMFGYEREQYLGQPLINFHVDRKQITDILERVSRNESIKNCEAQVYRQDGSICDISIDVHGFFKDDKFIHARCFTRDITDQKSAEAVTKATLSSLQFQQYALDRSAIVAATDRDGTIISVNKKFCEISQYSADELIGKTHRVINSGYHSSEFFRELWVVITSGKVWNGEIKNRAKDGSYYWVATTIVPCLDESGKPFQYLSIRFDITARKQLESDQERFLNVGSDLQVIADSNGYFTWVSPTFEQVLDRTLAEMTSRPWIEFVHPDDTNPTVTEETSIFNGIKTNGFENRYRHRDGSYRWFSWKAQTDADERLIYGVAVDITAKKQLEQQFLRAQRLESLGSLASGIAHDLNNVLTPIVGAAQLLPLTMPDLDARSRRLLDMLVESSQRGSGLVKQILAFAQGMDEERATIQLRHILAEIISVARQTFPKSIEINLSLATEDLWLVNVDATQIHQVMMNLFVNARDAMPDGGILTASAENITIDAALGLSLELPIGSYLLVTVADTGIGMTSQTLGQIFEPFFTTKDTGTGLGLSTVRGIIKTHGGSIDVKSEIGTGTCFKIYLPAIASREPEAPTVDEDSYDGKGQLVLVVDDEVAIREITQAALEMYNYRVILAPDGIEAIDIYAQNHQSISIVLVDMMMPHLDTPSIILTLKKINPQVKVVVMSGSYFNLEEVGKAQQVSAAITKPFTTISMLQVLANI